MSNIAAANDVKSQITEDAEYIDLENTGADDGAAKAIEKQDRTKAYSERLKKEREKIAEQIRSAEIDPLKSELTKAQQELLIYKAAEAGQSVDDYRQALEDEEKQIEELINNHPKVKALEKKNLENYKKEALKQINELFPGDNVESLDDLGVEFFKELGTHADPIIAYKAYRAIVEKDTPKSTGSVRSIGDVIGKELLTGDEIDRITEQDYIDHPELLEKVRKSLSHI